jgi:NAD(P)-dependent dehydrogenase (short-subunit alcohol dehydrogenase family)
MTSGGPCDAATGQAEQRLPQSTEFSRKRVLVSGGTKGIGAAIFRRLAYRGATILTTAWTIPPDGPSDGFIQSDINTRDGADQVIKDTCDRLGSLDILITAVRGFSAPGGGTLAAGL